MIEPVLESPDEHGVAINAGLQLVQIKVAFVDECFENVDGGSNVDIAES